MKFLALPRKYFATTIIGLAMTLAAAAWSQETKAHPDTSGWKDLFSADLSNAVMKPGDWAFEKGELVAKNHETIWTKESYGDFTLDLEFKVSKGANSGVFLRSGNIKDVLAALEIQVHENTDGSRVGMVGALYDCKAPSKSMAKPAGEWNHWTLTCQGSKLSLIFNGVEVQNLDLNDWNQPRKNQDGTPNKFSKALKDYARKGPIGFQGIHGAASALVWYRNVKIKPLD